MKLIIAVAAVVAGPRYPAVSTLAAAQGIESKKSRFALPSVTMNLPLRGAGR